MGKKYLSTCDRIKQALPYPVKCEFLNGLSSDTYNYIDKLQDALKEQKEYKNWGCIKTTNLINSKLEDLDADNADDIIKVWYLVAYNNWEFDNIERDTIDDVAFYDGQSLTQVAKELVNEGIFGELDANNRLHNYIDYEAIGCDLRHDGYEEVNEGNIYGVFQSN